MAEDPLQRTARLLRWQGEACRALGSPLYGDLLHHASTNLLAGGVVARVLAGHLEDPGPSALALRMMGGIHALVLSGQAPQVAAYFPSAGGSVDGGRDGIEAWRAVTDLLEAHLETVREWLLRAPQTNEVGRGAALIGGLRHVTAEAALPVRLVEVGASAGLNLRADHFRIDGRGTEHGDPASPVQLGDAWRGPTPPAADVEVVSRLGGDLCPVDPATEHGALVLAAYVWADQTERLERLRGGLELARQVPATLRQEPADRTLGGLELLEGTWTVLWHSVFRQYLDDEQRAEFGRRVDELGSRADGRARFAELAVEPERRSADADHEFLVTLTTWPGGRRRVLGTAAPHGLPTTWEQ